MQPVAIFLKCSRPGILAVGLLAGLLPQAKAQYEGVTSVVTTTGSTTSQTRGGITASGAGAPGFNVTYDGVSLEIDQIIVASGTYAPVAGGVAITRRNSATPVYPTSNGDYTTSWNATVSVPANPVSGPTGARTVRGTYSDTMDELFTSSNLYTGTENLFVNIDGTSTNVVSNVERMDFVFEDGLVISADQAFAVFERGGNGGGANGGFKVALITGVDENLVPTSFADTIITVTTNSYGITDVSPFRYDVYRNLESGGTLSPGLDWLNNANIGPQGIGGALFATSDFATVGSTFYGYAVFGLDVAATNGAQLVDWQNATYFPTNSPFSNDVDMVATGAAVFTAVPEPTVLGLASLGLGAFFLRRRRR